VFYFQFGFSFQPVLVSCHADRRAESHLVVATCAPAERATANGRNGMSLEWRP
jgi:hypothetical protein